jgi:hypothetical protein
MLLAQLAYTGRHLQINNLTGDLSAHAPGATGLHRSPTADKQLIGDLSAPAQVRNIAKSCISYCTAGGDSPTDVCSPISEMLNLVPYWTIHCKNRLMIFPSPARMSITKLSLDGNY